MNTRRRNACVPVPGKTGVGELTDGSGGPKNLGGRQECVGRSVVDEDRPALGGHDRRLDIHRRQRLGERGRRHGCVALVSTESGPLRITTATEARQHERDDRARDSESLEALHGANLSTPTDGGR